MATWQILGYSNISMVRWTQEQIEFRLEESRKCWKCSAHLESIIGKRNNAKQVKAYVFQKTEDRHKI